MTLSAVPPELPVGWPDADGHLIVFLVDASSSLERRLVGRWIDENRPAGSEYRVCAAPPSRRRRQRAIGAALRELAAGDTDPMLVPIRVAWLGPRRSGRRIPRLLDLITLGDPRDPNRLIQELFVRYRPDRLRIVVGQAATLHDLRTRWVEARTARPDDPHGFAEYIALQGGLTLEVAERRIRGNRSKVPRLLAEDLLGSAKFHLGVERLARRTGMRVDDLGRKTGRYLKEIAARPSTFVIDLVASLIRLVYTQGYDQRIQYDSDALERIAVIGQEHALAFLPSHRSNLDHLALTYVLYENGLPPNHAAGGINMNFFPVGPFLRRHGLFFIRRSFKGNEAYKFTLKGYLDYLLEKRFPLEWYIEGGRSRVGKMRAPKYGLLSYVVDSWRRGSCDDVVLIPTSIAYDQIQDVGAYAAEQRGGTKEKESFGWMVRALRTLRRRYGRIYINFGEPISLADTVSRYDSGDELDPEDFNLEVGKLAFEVAVRINRVAPITPISLVTIALLGAGDRALTVPETMEALQGVAGDVERRELPMSEPVDLDDPDVVRGALDALVEHGVVTRVEGGRETVYAIGADQHLSAAYYRNTIVHFFTNRAIAELALAAAAGATDDRLKVFWATVRRARDVLKFEFFFSGREEFQAGIAAELEVSSPRWKELVESGQADEVLGDLDPPAASWVLRPIFEAYRVLADALVDVDYHRDVDAERLVKQALALGNQYRMQRVITSPEAVSTVLFSNAIDLARNRRVMDGGDVSVLEARESFAVEMVDSLALVGETVRLRG